jgi:predicted GNAT family N-acyltransferase
MFHHNSDSMTSSFRKIGFSEKVWRCLERADRNQTSLHHEDRIAILRLLDQARKQVEIASDEVILPLLDKNPRIIQAVKGKEVADGGLLAILPLNDDGLEALASAAFDGRNPNIDWICEDQEQPSALYIWLVFMPGTFGQSLAAIANAIDPMALAPCPMFSRATNAHADRLHQVAGFKSARDYYPDCADDLQVVFPEVRLTQPPKPQNEIRLARTIDDIMRVFSVRSATYLAEQFCSFEEEFDGNDFCSTHFLGLADGDAAGCVRLRFFEGFAKLERLAVRAEYRQSRLAYQLVREALHHCQKKGYRRILGHSRLDLVRFWRTFGFRQNEARPIFSFAGIKYAEIILDLDPLGEEIRIDAAPMIILRPEGAWDRPGPFERAPQTLDPRRQKLIEERTRTVQKQRIAA